MNEASKLHKMVGFIRGECCESIENISSQFSCPSFLAYVEDRRLHRDSPYKKSSFVAQYDEGMKTIERIKNIFSESREHFKLEFHFLQHLARNSNDIYNGFYYAVNELNPELIIASTEKHVSDWVNLCQKNNINVDENIKNINNAYLGKFDGLNDFEDIRYEFSGIIREVSSFVHKYFSTEEFEKNDMIVEFKEKLDRYNQINNPIYANTTALFSKVGMFEMMETILQEISNMQDKFLLSNHTPHLTLAHKAYKELNKSASDIVSFIEKKDKNINLEELDGFCFSFESPNNKKFSNYIMFQDDSTLTMNSDGIYTINKNRKDNTECVESIFRSFVNKKLRKNPTVAKFMVEILEKDFRDIVECNSAIENYLENKAIIKLDNLYRLRDSMGESIYFEKIDDYMADVVKTHKSYQYAHSIASNKYLDLYDDKSYSLIKQIEDLKVEPTILQDTIGKKMAAFKTSEDFNEALTKLLNTYNEFAPSIIEHKANIHNIKIVVNEDNIMVLKIDDFEKSKLMGSSSWCISRTEHYFDSYTRDNASQYFIYDFNQDSNSIDSMIGLTIKEDGSYHAAHKKNDLQCEATEIDNIRLKIVKNNPESHLLFEQTPIKKLNNKATL